MTVNDMHANFDELVAYAAGRLLDDAAGRVAALIQADPSAAAVVARYRKIVETARNDDSVPVPTALLEQAKQLFRERRVPTQQTEGLLAALVRVVAELVFDGRRQPALAGLRGGRTGYQLSYESEMADIDLEITHSGEKSCRVMGQISPREQVAIQAITLTPAAETRTVASGTPDDSGVFELTVAPGTYDIQIRLPGSIVVLQEIEIE